MITFAVLLRKIHGRMRLRRRHGEGAIVTTRRSAELRRSEPFLRLGVGSRSGGVSDALTIGSSMATLDVD
jgi:hypothetical protein